jgi:hypothetical protein
MLILECNCTPVHMPWPWGRQLTVEAMVLINCISITDCVTCIRIPRYMDSQHTCHLTISELSKTLSDILCKCGVV